MTGHSLSTRRRCTAPRLRSATTLENRSNVWAREPPRITFGIRPRSPAAAKDSPNSPGIAHQGGDCRLRPRCRGRPSPAISSQLPGAPEVSQCVVLQPLREVISVKASHLGLSVVLLADHDTLRVVGQRIDEHIRMSRHDDLTALGCRLEEVGQGRKQIRMQPQFRFFDHDERRWFRVQQNGQQAQVAQRSVRQTRGRDLPIADLLQE